MATIVMSARQVINAANATIAYIEGQREKEDENNIRRVMLSTRIGAWFKRYNPTREQAIKILDNSCEFMGWRSCRGWGDLRKAQDLLRLAKMGDPVTLNEDDVRVLF